jgi:hypothetical protein
MVGEVVGGVERRHERKRTLGRIPLGFVVDVVKDQPVEAERTKTSDCDVGDLLCSFAIRRETRRGESKEQELALAGINAADQVHGRDGIGIIGGSCGRGQDAEVRRNAQLAARRSLVVLLARSELAAGCGAFTSRRTSPTRQIQTASLAAAAWLRCSVCLKGAAAIAPKSAWRPVAEGRPDLPFVPEWIPDSADVPAMFVRRGSELGCPR